MTQPFVNPRKKRLRKKVRWTRLFLVVLCLILCLAASYKIFSFINFLFFQELETSQVTFPQGMEKSNFLVAEKINVLLLGVNKINQQNGGVKADTILFFSFDKLHKKVSVLAIPRDTLVNFAQTGKQEKINLTYTYGQEAFSRQTVANFLSVPVNYHVILDMEVFKNIVDTLGGIKIYVENDMYYHDPKQNLTIDIKKGYQKLDGTQSLNYVRFKNDELSDMGRVLRQQKFLQAFADELFRIETFFKLPSLQPVFQQMLHTDINTLAFSKMCLSFGEYSKSGINFEVLPGHFELIGEKHYWLASPQQVSSVLKKLEIEQLN